MSYVIPDPYSFPITIPGASLDGPGVMTPEQVAALDDVAPGDFVPLDLAAGFTAASAPFSAPMSRVKGDEVELAGLVGAPNTGTTGSTLMAILPVDQHPATVRILTCGMQEGSNPWDFNTISIDDATGSQTGTPGAISINNDTPVGGAIITLDGLSFLL